MRMTTITAVSAFVLLSLTLKGYAEDDDKLTDRQLVKRAVADYIEGYYMSQPERLDRALHPTLAKRYPRVLADTGGVFMQPVTKRALIEYSKAGYGQMKPGEEFFLKISKIDVYGDIATAKAVSPYYVDYVHLVKLDGHWQIINVLWNFNQQK